MSAVLEMVQSPSPRCADLAGFPDAARGQWHVLHTRSRQEKIVAADLAAMGLACFLPLTRQVRYYGRRKALADLPLFPGYVFLRGSIEDAFLVDRTGRIAQIIRVRNQAQLDWELRNLYLAIARQVPLDPFPYLRRGTRVEVKAGPLRGVQGIVESRIGAQRLVLQVEMLGRAVSVEIDGALLEPLD